MPDRPPVSDPQLWCAPQQAPNALGNSKQRFGCPKRCWNPHLSFLLMPLSAPQPPLRSLDHTHSPPYKSIAELMYPRGLNA
jgi:hypothetical protein